MISSAPSVSWLKVRARWSSLAVGDGGGTGAVQFGDVAGGAGDGAEPVQPVQLGLHVGQCRLGVVAIGGKVHDSIHGETFTGRLLAGTAGEGEEQEGYQSGHTKEELPRAVWVPVCGVLSEKVPSHMENSLSKRDSLVEIFRMVRL